MSNDPQNPPLSHGLSVRGLARRFGSRWALARVSLDIPRGQVLMLTGANGSGKTTLLRCLASAIRPHQGTVTLDGKNLWTQRATLRPQIGFLAHATRLYEDLSARDNLHVWAKMGGYTVDIDALLHRVKLDPTRSDPAKTFSAGMRRRLSLARTLIKRPSVLLLDEPFAAFDPAGQSLIRSVITELRQQNATIVMTTHVPQLAAHVCDSSIHLREGQIVWRGTAEQRNQADWSPS